MAGLHLEDQVMPKKCGHMSGKAVIAADEMVGKIRAAVAARRDPDLVLIARTDAAAVEGLDAAIARARALRRGRRRRAVRRGPDQRGRHRPGGRASCAGVAPLVFNWAEGGRTPPLPLDRIAELGFSLVLFPIGTLLAATAGIRALLATICAPTARPAAGDAAACRRSTSFTDLIGLPEVRELEQRFRS